MLENNAKNRRRKKKCRELKKKPKPYKHISLPLP